MLSKSVKRFLAIFLALAIFAVGMPISFPTVVKAESLSIPSIGDNTNLATTLGYTEDYGTPGATFEYDEENLTVTLNSKVNWYLDGPKADREGDVLYVVVDVKLPDDYAEGLANGSAASQIGLNYALDNTQKNVCIGSKVRAYRHTAGHMDMQWYYTFDSSGGSKGYAVYGGNLRISAGDTITLAFAYDYSNKTVTTWFQQYATNQFIRKVYDFSDKNWKSVIGFAGVAGTVFSNIKVWKENKTEVNYANYALATQNGEEYHNNSYSAISNKDTYVFSGLKYDLTNGKEIVVEAVVDFAKGAFAKKYFAALAPVKLVTTTPDGTTTRNQVGVYLTNNGGAAAVYPFMSSDGKTGSPIIATWPHKKLEGYDTGKKYLVKIVVTETRFEYWINNWQYTTSGQQFYKDYSTTNTEDSYSKFVPIDFQIILSGLQNESTVSDIKIYGSGVSGPSWVAIPTDAPTYAEFTISGAENAKQALTSDRYVNILSGAETTVLNTNTADKQVYVAKNIVLDKNDVYLIDASFKATGANISMCGGAVGVYVGTYNKTATGIEGLYITAVADENDNYSICLVNDNNQILTTIADATSFNQKLGISGAASLKEICLRIFNNKSNITVEAKNAQDIYVELGTLNVETTISTATVNGGQEVGTNFEFGVGVVAENSSDTAEIKVTGFSVRGADIDYVAPVGNENGNVYVTDIDTISKYATAVVAPNDGYQLAAGSLKVNGKNIINSVDSTGTTFDFTYAANSKNKIEASFNDIANTSISSAVLGTTVRHASEDIDGIRFLHRIYLDGIFANGDVNVQRDTLTVKYGGVEYVIKDYGMLCDRSERVTGELTMDNAKWKVSGKNGYIFALTDNYIDMTIVVTTSNPNENFYKRDYITRGYVVLEGADGSTKTILTEEFNDSCETVVDRVPLFINQVSIESYSIVVSENCDKMTYYAAQILTEYVYQEKGIVIPIYFDSNPETQYEILIGDTNREESDYINPNEIPDGNYLLTAANDKILIYGEDYLIGAGVGELVNDYFEKGLEARISEDEEPELFEFEEADSAILMIADGMGANHIEAAKKEGIANFYPETLPVINMMSTLNIDNHVTDSAAAATAMSTGQKTKNKYVGLDKDGNKITNMTELVSSKGGKVALTTTEEITGATPAGFAVHVENRNMSEEILAQYAELKAKGMLQYAVGDLGDDLCEFSADYLWDIAKDDSTFFMLVEEAHTDKSSHSNDYTSMISAVNRFNDTTAYFIQYCVVFPHVALIITADHETGALTKNGDDFEFTSVDHSGAEVKFFAMGAGTEVFAKDETIVNTEIAVFIAEIFGVKNFGK